MKKVILEDVGKIKIVDAPEPVLKEGEALIEMKEIHVTDHVFGEDK